MKQLPGATIQLRPRRKLVRALATGLASVAVLALAAVSSWTPASRSQTSDGARPSPGSGPAGGEVHTLARLEPAAGIVTVGARPGARIERLLVSAGDKVAAGQVLGVLEGRKQAQAQLALVEAQKAQARHKRAIRKQTLALEREQFDKLQKAKLDAATRVAFISNQRFDENTKLYKTLGAALQGKDKLEADLRYFESEVRKIQTALEKESLEIVQGLLPRQRQLEDGELGDQGPDMDVIDRQVDLARVALEETELRAPVAGEVLELLARAGEVSSGPLLAMGDLSSIVATAEVYQSDVTRLSLGDPATVKVLDQQVSGKVTRIGALVGKNQLVNLDPRALQDRRVVKVTIGLDDPTLARRLVNMEVDVTIRAGGASGSQTASGNAGE